MCSNIIWKYKFDKWDNGIFRLATLLDENPCLVAELYSKFISMHIPLICSDFIFYSYSINCIWVGHSLVHFSWTYRYNIFFYLNVVFLFVPNSKLILVPPFFLYSMETLQYNFKEMHTLKHKVLSGNYKNACFWLFFRP